MEHENQWAPLICDDEFFMCTLTMVLCIRVVVVVVSLLAIRKVLHFHSKQPARTPKK